MKSIIKNALKGLHFLNCTFGKNDRDEGDFCTCDKDIIIDATLKALSTIVLAQKIDIPPRERCPCGEDNCTLPMSDYDIGYNDALNLISQMILGEKGS